MPDPDILKIAARIARVADVIERDAQQDATRRLAQEVRALAGLLERPTRRKADE